MGKLATEELRKLLSCIKEDSRVIVPPWPGFDSGVHQIDGKYLVVSTDPCIGVPEKWFGWLLIHYATSDVALFGAKPEFCAVNLLGPPSTKPKVFYKIMKQTCNAADDLGMAVVTGHTGKYGGLSTLMGVCTAYGTVDKDKLMTPSDAKLGDFIFCIKPIGLETIVNFALMHTTLAKRLFGTQRTQELAELVHLQSCVKEALLLAEIGGVHALHDATEGGLTAALNEMATASKVGFEIDLEKLPIPEEVHRLQKYFCLSDRQVLSMSSTGTIVAAVDAEAKSKIETELSKREIEASVIGFFTKDKHRIFLKNGTKMTFPKKAYDPYEKIMTGK